MRNGLVQHREDLFTDDSQEETIISGTSNPFSSPPSEERTTYTLAVYVGLSDRDNRPLTPFLRSAVVYQFVSNPTVNIIAKGVLDSSDELGNIEQSAHWLLTTDRPWDVVEGLKALCAETNQRSFGLVGLKHDQTIWEV